MLGRQHISLVCIRCCRIGVPNGSTAGMDHLVVEPFSGKRFGRDDTQWLIKSVKHLNGETMTPSDNKRLLAALNENWQAEMEGFSTYSALAKNENDPHRRNALRGLA